jgi:hypothetical protein
VYWFSVRIAIPSELRNGDPSLVVAMVVVVVAKQRLCDAMRCDAMRCGGVLIARRRVVTRTARKRWATSDHEAAQEACCAVVLGDLQRNVSKGCRYRALTGEQLLGLL